MSSRSLYFHRERQPIYLLLLFHSSFFLVLVICLVSYCILTGQNIEKNGKEITEEQYCRSEKIALHFKSLCRLFLSHWKKEHRTCGTKPLFSRFSQNAKIWSFPFMMWTQTHLVYWFDGMFCVLSNPRKSRDGWMYIILIWLGGEIYISDVHCKIKIWLF